MAEYRYDDFGNKYNYTNVVAQYGGPVPPGVNIRDIDWLLRNDRKLFMALYQNTSGASGPARPGISGKGASRRIISGTDNPPSEMQLTTVSTGALLPLVYGKVRMGPQVGFPWVSGSTLYYPAYWCEGRIESITLYLDDEVTTANHVSHYYGDPDQTLDSTLSSALSYTDDHDGVAYSVLKFAADENPNGIVAEIEGRRIYDPRDVTQSAGDATTWKYSANPALVLADFHQKYRGQKESIDWTSVEACADYCDELLSGQKRAAINVALNRRVRWETQFNALKAYAFCYVYYDEDTLIMVPDKPGGSVVATLTESDIIQDSLNLNTIDVSDAPDQVIVQYTNTSVTPWFEDVAQTTPPAGGAKNPQVINMSGWQSHAEAYRYAVYRMNHFNLINFGGSFRTYDAALQYAPGDIIQMTHSRGLNAKLMVVQDVRAYDLSRYEVSVVEYQPVWSDVVETEPTFPDLDLPSPSSFPTVTGLTAVEQLWQADNGTWHTVFKVTFDGGDWPHTSGFRYSITRQSDAFAIDESTIAYQGDVTHTFISPPSTVGQIWVIKVWVVNKYGNHDPATYAQTTVIGAGHTIPPLNIPEGTLKSIEYGQFVRLSWGAAADSDLSGYEIARLNETDYDSDVAAENDPFDNANTVTLIDRIDALLVLLDAQPVGATGSQTWAYGVRPIDRQGNKALGRWVKQLVTAEKAGAIGVEALDHLVSSLTNMATTEYYGVGIWAYTSYGDSWSTRFGGTTGAWPSSDPWIHNLSSTGTCSVSFPIASKRRRISSTGTPMVCDSLPAVSVDVPETNCASG